MNLEHSFIAFDGTPLHFKEQPLEDPKAILLVVHGMGEHGGRYMAFSQKLALSGIKVFSLDLRGYGRSGGGRGHIQTFTDYFRDLEALQNWLEKQHPNKPLYILGHSFGGLIVSAYVALYAKGRIAGIILSSPLWGIYGRIAFWRHALFRLLSYVLPKHRERTRVSAYYLTHDKAIARAYKKDPLVHYDITARLYSEMTKMMARREEIGLKLMKPLLLMQAGDDKIVSKEASVAFFHSVSSKDKSLEICEGLYHEILNEIERDRVISAICLWIEKRIV